MAKIFFVNLVYDSVHILGNYRRLCLFRIGSKIVEALLLNRMDVYLQTTPRQFGFKEILRSAVHVAFLDASKAFDRVNRHKLITKLAQRDVPKYFLRVINAYNNRSVCARWDLLTRNSSLWVMVLSKEGNYAHYCLTFIWTT